MGLKVNNGLGWTIADPSVNIYFRRVYISKSEVENSRWVAKVHPPAELNLLAEELAYKIDKTLKWNTIPKTKCLHPFIDFNGKYKKYSLLLPELLPLDPQPQAYTFQKYVDGCTMKEYTQTADKIHHFRAPLNKRSFQKARLLNLILGRYDTKPDNTMVSYSTGEFSEVDNEMIGSRNGSSFALSGSHLDSEEIEEDILEEVLQADPEKFFALRNKYRLQINKFISSWNQKSGKKLNIKDASKEFETTYSQILQNIEILKCSIGALRSAGEAITSRRIDRAFVFLMEMKTGYRRPRLEQSEHSKFQALYHELDAQMHEVHAKL